MKRFSITERQREQAERMVEKWRARAEAFYSPGGWSGSTEGYCKTVEDADRCELLADTLRTAVAGLVAGVGTWEDVQVVNAAVAARDSLDGALELARQLRI